MNAKRSTPLFLAFALLMSACSLGGTPETVEVTRVVVVTETNQSEAAAPTVMPVVQVQGCPPAMDLGPWAPNDGLGENFEVTANETVSAGVHIQLWWPGGTNQPWGTEEISVLVPSGLSIEVQDGAGRGWEYPLGCPADEIERQIAADNARRETDTAYYGRVEIDTLIKTGLIVVRFDRRTGSSVVNPTVVPGAAPTSAVANLGFIGRDGDADNRTIGDDTYAYVIEAWEPVEGIIVVPVGESYTGAKGANWKFGSTDAALADAQTKGKTVYIVQNGKLVKQ